MALSDEQIADAISTWWQKFYPDTPEWQTRSMVKRWILELTRWGHEMEVVERVKLQNRVTRILFARRGAASSRTRRTKRKAAEETKRAQRQKIFDF